VSSSCNKAGHIAAMGNVGSNTCSSALMCSVPIDDIDANDSSAVFLNVYDLSEDWLHANNIFVDVLQLGGAFHAGVEVHGKEWSYGSSGVSWIAPRSHDVHIYRQSVLIGLTMSNPVEIITKLEREVKPHWPGDDYDLFKRNCCNFSDELCQLLAGKQIPAWVNRFPTLALAATRRWKKMMEMIPRQPLSMDSRADILSDTTGSIASGESEYSPAPSSVFTGTPMHRQSSTYSPWTEDSVFTSEHGTSLAGTSCPVSPESSPGHRQAPPRILPGCLEQKHVPVAAQKPVNTAWLRRELSLSSNNGVWLQEPSLT